MKMRFVITIAIGAVAVFVMAFQNDANAWTSWGQKYADSKIPVPMEANQAGTGDCSATTEFGALSRAGRTWIMEPCSYFAFRVGDGHPNNRGAPIADGVNNVTWDYGYGGLAVTYLWGGGATRQNDTIFNEQYSWSCSGNPGIGHYDVETVALHEFGHVLGLGHSGDSSAVMYAYYHGVLRNLQTDDSNGVCSLYPAGASAITDVQVQDLDF